MANLMRWGLGLALVFIPATLGGCSQKMGAEQAQALAENAPHLDPVTVSCDVAGLALLSYQSEARTICGVAPGSCPEVESQRDARTCLLIHRCANALGTPEQRGALAALREQRVACVDYLSALP